MSQTTMIAMLEEAEDVLRRAGCDVTADKVRGVLQAQWVEPVNQQLLALVKSFGHKTGCAKNAFGELCTCGVDEAIAAAEQAQQITDNTRVAWTSLGTVKAMLPELLESDDVKVRENAQIIDALVKLVGCQQAKAEPVAWKTGKRPPSVFKTSEAGRQYVADFFANALRRHDFYSYIKGHLAADFACALSDGLHAMQTVQQQAEPVAWQFYQDGKWWNGYENIKDHRKNTEDAGIPTRDLYAQPPAVACNHRIADARNPVVSSGYVCVDCGALFSAADHNEPPAVAVPDGYALVPIEPTPEMVAAGAEGDSQFYDHASFVYRAMLAAAPAQAAAIPDELTCEDIERLRLALSWEGYSTPESLEACAARWPSLVRDLIAGVLDRKKRTQDAAQKGGEA